MSQALILVVDGDASMRKFMRANLEARDYTVLSAKDGGEALKVIETALPDLIVMDIMIPKLKGLEVCRKIKTWSKIPILMLSAWEGGDYKLKCMDAGADGYLTKPFFLKELLSRIEALQMH